MAPSPRFGLASFVSATASLCDARIHGLLRSTREHFSVLLRDRESRVWRLRSPCWGYLADPFLVQHEGRRALLVEYLDYRTNKGELCAIALDDPMRPGPLQSILPSRAHASFPFVFRHQGKLFLVPETSTDCTVEIHVCEEFPTRWRLERVVLQGIDAADSIIFLKDGRWWLISAIRSREGRHLEIFFADDPLHGRWQAHPVNQTRLYQRVPFTSGRNAGPVIEHQGLLLRAAQRSRRYYGEGMQLMRIEMLTPTDYRERLYDGPHPLRGMIADWSPHHLSLADGFAAFDIRDRARDLQGLRSMPIVRRPRPEGDIPIPLAAS